MSWTDILEPKNGKEIKASKQKKKFVELHYKLNFELLSFPFLKFLGLKLNSWILVFNEF